VRREALKARVELDRRLALTQHLTDALTQHGIAFTVETDHTRGGFPAWPVVGSQIDWAAVPGATYIEAGSDDERDAAVRNFLSRFSSPAVRVDIILSNGDAPIITLLTGDLATICGSVLGGDISMYLAPAEEGWLIENLEGRGVWGGIVPAELDR